MIIQLFRVGFQPIVLALRIEEFGLAFEFARGEFGPMFVLLLLLFVGAAGGETVGIAEFIGVETEEVFGFAVGGEIARWFIAVGYIVRDGVRDARFQGAEGFDFLGGEAVVDLLADDVEVEGRDLPAVDGGAVFHEEGVGLFGADVWGDDGLGGIVQVVVRDVEAEFWGDGGALVEVEAEVEEAATIDVLAFIAVIWRLVSHAPIPPAAASQCTPTSAPP